MTFQHEPFYYTMYKTIRYINGNASDTLIELDKLVHSQTETKNKKILELRKASGYS